MTKHNQCRHGDAHYIALLPKEAQAQLAQRLVLNLESPSKEELRPDWLNEARRRAEELDSGSVQAVPSEDVMRKARDLIK